MKYFSAFYLMPVATLDEWMKKPAEERSGAEGEFKQKWDAWLEGHKDVVLKTIAMGKTKVVTKDGGVKDTRNEMMMSSYVQAESLEAAADIFKDHPHLEMPGGRIEVVETRDM